MTERWERELRKLDTVDAPPRIRDRIDEGASDEGAPALPGTRQRIVAGVVAFGVFAAAGAFAFVAFNEDDVHLIGDPSTVIAEPLVIDVEIEREPEVDAVARLAYGHELLQACTSGVSIELADGRQVGYDADCDTPDPIRIPQGTPIEIEGGPDAFSVEMREGPPPDAAAGIYNVDLRVRWEPSETVRRAEATFVASIEILPAEEASHVPDVVVVASIDVTSEAAVPAASVSFGDQEREACLRGAEFDAEPISLRACTPPVITDVPLDAGITVTSDQPISSTINVRHDDGRELVTVVVSWQDDTEGTFVFEVARSREGTESVSPSPNAGGVGETGTPEPEVPDVLRFRCDPIGIEVLTPVVAAQADGLHVDAEVVGIDDAEIGLMSARVPGRSWWSGSSGAEGEFVRPVPVGKVRFVCEPGPEQGSGGADGEAAIGGATDLSTDPEAFEATFDLVDPDGHFVDHILTCPDQQDGFGSDGPNGERGWPTIEDAMRAHIEGLLDSDVIEEAGYPGGDEWPYLEARVVRDGEVIATAGIDGRSGWRFGVHDISVCTAHGLKVVDGSEP